MKKWLTLAAIALLAITNGYTLRLLAQATTEATRLAKQQEDTRRFVELLDNDIKQLESENRALKARLSQETISQPTS